jgi:CubicO group peptidase (beta-lactamase class C family)
LPGCLGPDSSFTMARYQRRMIMHQRHELRRGLLFVCFVLASTFAAAQGASKQSSSKDDLPKLSRPEEAGFSSERLARITAYFQGEVDKGAVPGAVVVVARNGKIVYRQAVGYQDREKKSPMKVDASRHDAGGRGKD